MDSFIRNNPAAPLVRFEGIATHRSSPTKIVAFAVIALMMAYVICHNKAFLDRSEKPGLAAL
jgi:hypothetical protein